MKHESTSPPTAAPSASPSGIAYPVSNGEHPRTQQSTNPLIHPSAPTDGAALLDDLTQTLKRFVILPKWAPETLALWILHTYAFHLRDVTTYIGIESPEKRCGKTTLVTVLAELVNRPEVAANISSSAFFRTIEENHPTLLIDEADTLLPGNDELRGILNSGYSRKTAYVLRVSYAPTQQVSQKFDVQSSGFKVQGSKPEIDVSAPSCPISADSPFVSDLPCRISDLPLPHQSTNRLIHQSTTPPLQRSTTPLAHQSTNPGIHQSTQLARFSSWCPKLISTIGRLPDTLADRCILIRMHRKMASDRCDRLRDLDASSFGLRCRQFVADHTAQIASARPATPPGIHDRAADIWEPLLALADLAGRDWPGLARQAAVALSSAAQENCPIGSLLMDILLVFATDGLERVFSRDLVNQLAHQTDRPWNEALRGRPPTDLWLARQLRPYGIRPRSIWIGPACAKGYLKSDFKETFPRYIPTSEVEDLHTRLGPGPKNAPPAHTSPEPDLTSA